MHAKKSLGQHFLTSEDIAASIASAAHLTSADTVLEIGPGTGILTRELLKCAGRVVAIEKDERLAEKLRKELPDQKLTLTSADALTIDFETLGLRNQQFAVVANIPYYITGAFIEKILSSNVQPSRAVLLVQKEVAERIVAKDGKESVLSMSVKVYGTPRYVKTVRAGSFNPPPKVDSAVLAIEDISRDAFTDVSEELFFQILKAGFAHKRKLLSNNLVSFFDTQRDTEATLATYNIPLTARAEELAKEQWLELARHLQ